MPELPEVETVRRDLSRSILGATVCDVECLRPDMLTVGCPADLRDALVGARIEDIERHGKALILRFSSGWSLIVHFRMTGQLYPVPGNDPLPDYARTVLRLHDGRALVHVDTRRLGTLELLPTAEEPSAATLANLGPDALKDPPALQRLRELLGARRCAVKLFLLDQKALAGVGNIYACEILHRAGIHPETPCCAIGRAAAARLGSAITQVLGAAIEARGSTISDYRTGTGDEGAFQRRLCVYGREGEACLAPGCRGVIRRIVQGQRSTFFCPHCQRYRGRR